MSLVLRLARKLAPDEMTDRISDLSPQDLLNRGVQGLIIDLDNTLCRWQSEEIPEDIGQWLNEVRAAGISLCIASNTHDRSRLKRMAEALGIQYVDRVPKPRRSCFGKALAHLGVPAEAAAVVGDQMFTDILGGKRSGLHTIMVRPIHHREFIGTKISRLAEGILLRLFKKHGVLPGSFE